jgi:uncharacterized protein (DUF2236 family)
MSVARRINAERLVVLGWGRAILMQLAHPLVAQGLADHSTFREDAYTRVRRLHETIRAMLALTFGSSDEAAAATARINAIHQRVHGRLKEPAGRFEAGAAYTATDPQLLLWVDATLMDSLPMAYERLAGDLTPADLDAYCVEVSASSPALHIPLGLVPASRAALEAYLADMLNGNALSVTAVAKELAGDVVSPQGWRALGPVAELWRLTTVGWLPPSLREAYGFGWDDAQEARLDRWCRRIKAVRHRTPDWLAQWRPARRV